MGSGRELEEWLGAKTATGESRVHRNLHSAALVEAAIRREEGVLADNGALVVRTGAKTGRSADDKYVVANAANEKEIWWGPAQKPISAEVFNALLGKAVAHLKRVDSFVFDGFAGASPAHRLPVRVVTERAWQCLFARTLFIRPTAAELATAPTRLHRGPGREPAGGRARPRGCARTRSSASTSTAA